MHVRFLLTWNTHGGERTFWAQHQAEKVPVSSPGLQRSSAHHTPPPRGRQPFLPPQLCLNISWTPGPFEPFAGTLISPGQGHLHDIMEARNT